MRGWLEIAVSPTVVKRSLKVAAIVGTLIGLINYADKILLGSMTAVDTLKFALTYLVPFAVSTYAAVSAIREMERMRKTQP